MLLFSYCKSINDNFNITIGKSQCLTLCYDEFCTNVDHAKQTSFFLSVMFINLLCSFDRSVCGWKNLENPCKMS